MIIDSTLSPEASKEVTLLAATLIEIGKQTFLLEEDREKEIHNSKNLNQENKKLSEQNKKLEYVNKDLNRSNLSGYKALKFEEERVKLAFAFIQHLLDDNVIPRKRVKTAKQILSMKKPIIISEQDTCSAEMKPYAIAH